MLAAAGEIELPVTQMIVTVALPLSAALSEFVAVTVTLAGEGTVAGAVYTAVAAPLALPVGIMVPTAEFPPTTELTLHVKLAPAPDPPERLAEKICAPLVAMFTAPGEMVTVTPPELGVETGEAPDWVVPQLVSTSAQTQITTALNKCNVARLPALLARRDGHSLWRRRSCSLSRTPARNARSVPKRRIHQAGLWPSNLKRMEG
jgi:hypothetical protein